MLIINPLGESEDVYPSGEPVPGGVLKSIKVFPSRMGLSYTWAKEDMLKTSHEGDAGGDNSDKGM